MAAPTREEIANRLHTSTAAAIDAMRKDRPRIAEREFIEKYLWFFVKFILPNEEGTDEELRVDYWLTVAGNVRTAVDVVDDMGKVLFTVPPIIRTGISPMDDKDRVLYSALEESKSIDKIAPGKGGELLLAKFNEIGFGRNVNIANDRLEWFAIFKRYDLLPPDLAALFNGETAPASGDSFDAMDDELLEDV